MVELNFVVLDVLAAAVFLTLEGLKMAGVITSETSDGAQRIGAGLAAAVYTALHVFVFNGGVQVDSSNWLALADSFVVIATSAWGVATLAYTVLKDRIKDVGAAVGGD